MKMCLKICVVLFLSVVCVKSTEREKRLVLHSDTDIATEVLNMKAEISSLTATIANLNTSLVTANANHAQEISDLKSTLKGLTNNEHGSTYIRWGRTKCPGNATQLIYKGYMTGREYNSSGSGANHLCLPEDPTWANFNDANQKNDRGYLFGTEYEDYSHSHVFSKNVHDQDVPCAVCKAPGVSVMIPARTNCYPGWNLEFTGYIMSEYHGRVSPSDYVCVDADPEFIFRGEADTDGNRLFLVESMCGTLPCPPYIRYREVACSVCSK